MRSTGRCDNYGICFSSVLGCFVGASDVTQSSILDAESHVWAACFAAFHIRKTRSMVTEIDETCRELSCPKSASAVNPPPANSRRQRAIVESSHLNWNRIMRQWGSFRAEWLILVMGGILMLSACNRGRHKVLDVAYVSAPQAALRDQVAAIFNRVGNVKNGERLEVLDREKRFVRVRTSTGIEGWIEARFLVDQKTFD